jgi:hypothetical protein
MVRIEEMHKNEMNRRDSYGRVKAEKVKTYTIIRDAIGRKERE